MTVNPSHDVQQIWNDRFHAFVAQKTAAAVAARIPGFRTLDTRVSSPGLGAIGNSWTMDLFDGPFFESSSPHPRRPAMNLVFVQSADGNTGTDDPTSLGGGATDKHLIYEGLSSVHADAIITGTRTIHGSDMVMAVWHPELVRLRASLGLGRYPAQVVVTRGDHLSIESELIYNVPELRVFILTTPDGARRAGPSLKTRPWITVIDTGPTSNVVAGIEALHLEHGIQRMSCIGGRTLATALIDARVIQDLYLTTSPQRGGEPHTPFYTGANPLTARLVVKKVGRGAEAGVGFEHSTFG